MNSGGGRDGCRQSAAVGDREDAVVIELNGTILCQRQK